MRDKRRRYDKSIAKPEKIVPVSAEDVNMAGDSTYREAIRLFLLCAAWYFFSSANGIIGKIVLSEFPYPMTLSMVQLVSISAYLYPVIKLTDVPVHKIRKRDWFIMILPLSFGKFLASVTGHISIWKVPVSYAHTVKATMPLFTVMLSKLVFNEKQTWMVYSALLVIIGGVSIATVTELSFKIEGMISAIVATMGFAMLNVFSKKCLKDTGIHHLRLLFKIARMAALFFAPLWIVHDVTHMWNDTSLHHSLHLPRITALLIIDGFCNFGQNMAAFTVISIITPLSYAVANATKRIVIITASLLTLRNPVNFANVIGMMTAVGGVLLYNKAKYDQNQARKKATVLPYTQNGHHGHQPAQTSLLLQNDVTPMTSLTLANGHARTNQETSMFSLPVRDGARGVRLLQV